MTSSLTGRTALVTGATSGIGRATALTLAALGAHVLISGRDADRGAQVVKEIDAAGGRAQFLRADLADADAVRSLAARAQEAGGGRVDILVNNAGVFPFGPTAALTDADLASVLDINVKAPHILVGALAPGMAERGTGAVVNVSTMVADRGMNGLALYGASKAAVELLTKAWASEFGPSGVRVNAVAPGPTRTEGTAGMGESLDQMGATTPSGRVADPNEVAAVIAFLASDDAGYVHGAVVPVDGGRRAI